MRITVVVDANVIMSALLGGKSSTILFDHKFQFVTTQFTVSEVEKYFSRLEKKTGVSQKDIKIALENLPLRVYDKSFYEEERKEAERIIADIDEKDVDVLARALQLKTYVWSQDRDFEKCGYEKLLKTHHFIGE